MAAWGWTAALSGSLLVGVHWPIYLKAFQDHVKQVREAEAAAKAQSKQEKKKDEEEKKEKEAGKPDADEPATKDETPAKP